MRNERWRRGGWTCRRLVVGLTALLCLSLAAAQQSEVSLELGFNGEVVSGHWNPLRLTTRDTPPADLILSFDQSTFTEPENLAVYRASIPGSGGVAVFEDDVFVPEWRQLVWRLVSADAVLASGSLGRASRDARPVTLLLSATPFRWRDILGADTRVVDLPAHLLPERLAAFDGVSTLLIDGSAPAPNPAAIAAATSAGVHTLLVEPLPSSHDDLRSMAAATPVRLGAGWLVRTDAAGVGALRLPDLDLKAVTAALLSDDMHPRPQTPAQLPLTLVAGGYVLLVLLLLRFAATPGLVTSFAVALLAGVTAWLYLRPPAAQTVLSRTVVTSGGALARRDEVRSLFTLPRTTVHVAGAAQPTQPLPYTQTLQDFELALTRWGAVDLSLRPQLVDAALRWHDGALQNDSPDFLRDVFVTGVGPQPDLTAGADLAPQAAEEVGLPTVYAALLDLLPTGTALGRSGGTVYLALPPYESPGGSDARARR